jgi:hypothetical protein
LAAHSVKRRIMTETQNNKQGGELRLRRCPSLRFTRITTFLCRGLRLKFISNHSQTSPPEHTAERLVYRLRVKYFN